MPVKEVITSAKAIVSGEHSRERQNQAATNATKLIAANGKASITAVRVTATESTSTTKEAAKTNGTARKVTKTIL